MRISKKTQNRSLIFGDFDKDRVPNIDDKYPFNKKKKGKVQDVMLSTELREIKKHNLKFKKLLQKIKKKYGRKYIIKHRIKGTHSTIGKLRRKYMHHIEDILGVTIICKDKDEIDKVAKDLKKNFKTIKDQDYYKISKAGNEYYKARHITILLNKSPVEIQLKTMGHHEFHERTHPTYKKYRKIPEKKLKKLKKEAERITNRGR